MDVRNPKFPVFKHPVNAVELLDELSSVAREYVKGIVWDGWVPPPGVLGSAVKDLPEFKSTIKNSIQRYLASLDISEDERNKIYSEAMQHDLFQYQYLEAARSFIAEQFPYQVTPLVFFIEYNDHPRYTGVLDNSSAAAYDACVATYKKLYAYSMTLLKEFSEAIKTEDMLDRYITCHKQDVIFRLSREIKGDPSVAAYGLQQGIEINAEILYDIIFKSLYAAAKDKHLSGLNEALYSALFLTQAKFIYACDDEFKNTTQYDPDCNHRIRALLNDQAPLQGLRYYSEINCFAYKPPYRTPAMIFHSVAELIQELTSEARLKPRVAAHSPVSNRRRGAMFMHADNEMCSATTADDTKLSPRK